jgi:ligand-binding sensor domain-containing protein/serine phosphatase RsbU (regulator of sigma subunit)
MHFKGFIRKYFLVFILLLCTPCVYSQTLNLNQFGIEEGLPQSSIYTMLQDKQGSIWVGTMNGISKYNGLLFENFTKKNGLAENRVTASCLDKNGNIWFGHWSGGITLYSDSTHTFSEVLPENIKLFKTITCILSDKQGNIWFGTDGEGLLKYKNGKFISLTVKDGLTSNFISSLMENKNGELWIGTDNGITVWNNKFSVFNTSLPSQSIKALFCDSKNNIWIGTSDIGVVRINASNKKLNVYSTSEGLANNYVKVIFETDNGAIFIGTYGGGVSKYLPQLEANNLKGSFFQTISTIQGLSNDRVLSIIQDREKNIWIGTFLNLNQYFDEQFEIFGENEGLQNSLVWSIVQDRNNNFWLGTEDGLVEFINESSQNKESFYSNLNDQDRTGQKRYHFVRKTGKSGQVTNTSALYEDIKGNIWFSDFGHGLSRFNPATGKVKTYTKETGLSVNEIYCITGDIDGNIWIGTNNGGLLKFYIGTEKFEKYTTYEGLGSNQIYSIFCDSKNRMWLGSLSGDLTMLDIKSSTNGKVVFKKFSKKEGYPSKFTLSITEDAQGNIWFGTYDLGIYKYDGKTFTNYSTKEGLNSNTPFLLVCDNKNNLWIGTGLGIDKFNMKEETFKHYEKEDGFLGIEINPNSVCKDKQGNIWFGSIIGLVKYNSQFEKINRIEPITSIKNPRIFFQDEKIPSDHIFPWSKNHFTFDFIGASLTNPKRVKYRYILEGLDKEWSPVVKENSVTFSGLQAGNYTFKVRSCNNDGVWNKEPVIFSFVISPPFWKTTWFYIVLGIVIISALFFYIKWKEQKLKRANMILEQKVIERTEEVVKQKTEIEKKNLVITDSIEYAKNIQQAILPSDDDITKPFKDHFILYKPKDIVSGDFYWLHEDQNRTVISVADCTGHGVPGAFVSLMGHNLLNDTVNEKSDLTPAQILDGLNEKILNTLKQNNEGRSAKYGMDIAMISIDKGMKNMEFAGAHNPLLLYRNNELIELKANRFSIGSFIKEEDSGFTNQPFELQKGDMLYMFSDGYSDQIGGPEKKKFFAKPFRELLQSVCQLPMEDQKQKLEETIVSWRGRRDQTDDILLVGIRI